MIVQILEILFAGMCVGLASSVTVGPVAVLCIQRTLSKGPLSGLVSGFGVAFADAILAILAFSVFALLKSYIDEYYTAIQICAGFFVIIVGAFIFFKNPVPQIRKNRSGKTNLWQDFASMFGFTLANFVVIIPYILAFFAMFNVELSTTMGVEKPQTEVVEEHRVEVEPAAVQSAESTAEETKEVSTPTIHVVSSPEDVALPSDEVATPEPEVPEQAPAETANNGSNNTGMSGFFYNSLIILGFLLGAMVWWLSITFIINLFRKGFRPRHMLTINHIAGLVIGIIGIYTLLSVLIKW